MRRIEVGRGFTLVEAVVVLLIVGVFLLFVIPASRKAQEKRELKETMAQATQLWSVIMALNTTPSMTGKQVVAVWPTNTFRSSTEYFRRCLGTNRIGADVSLPLLAAPGVPAWTGTLDRLDASNVAWSVIRWDGVVGSNDPPFIISRNLVSRDGGATLIDLDTMKAGVQPFGDKVAVVVTVRGNLRLVESFRTNENFQMFLNPYADTNEVLRPEAPRKR
jgi:prepilin-type N-terminal cleavage/methylation domain-containing protein